MNNFFTPIFRLAKHHPLPWVPLRAINDVDRATTGAFVTTSKRLVAPAIRSLVR
ncbi:MAG TPA: hypothetical protein VHQ92_08810 [Pseudolabrys sp.]|nr:hypothetical protein [Pseudolabrys sp.]